jgi:hypothetical protein
MTNADDTSKTRSQPPDGSRDWTAQRVQTFGDWGAPNACWQAWDDGPEKWAEHARFCRNCAKTLARREAERRQAAEREQRGGKAARS